MKNTIIILLLLCALVSCGTQRKVVQQEVQNTRTETRYERILVHDTSYIEIPVQTAEKTVKDSTSHLENDYAVSDASITSDGLLYHSLRTKAQKKAVPVDKQIERKDSLVYVDKQVNVPVPVEKELTKWQSFKINYFGWLMAVLFALLGYTFRKPLLKLVRRFI